jgi:choline-sulfatase
MLIWSVLRFGELIEGFGVEMMLRPSNLLMIVGESHGRDLVGAYGHQLVKTPALDALAARGTLFRNNYCASPICVPSRASIATGLYPHQHRYWDNSIALDGRTPTWMRRIRDAGSEVVGVGKFHFRNGTDDNGFSEEIAAMHLAEGLGELLGLLRAADREPVRDLWELYSHRTGVGKETAYESYDKRITEYGIDCIKRHATQKGKPWALCVHYVSAHAPYTVTQELLDLYPLEAMPKPVQFQPDERPQHPALQHLRRILGQPEEVDEKAVRLLTACFFATITRLDREIGKLLAALDAAGVTDNTRVIYTADHGYSSGNHFLMGLFNLFEDTVGVPLIMAGPDIPANGEVKQLTSHVDLFPTILESMGVDTARETSARPGVSLWPALRGHEWDRISFAEYHALGSKAGSFMLRERDYKLIYHVGLPPQLFDLRSDPKETNDLAQYNHNRGRVAALEKLLRSIVSPEAIDAAAKADQRARIAELGGVDEVLARRSGFLYSPPPGADWRKM